MIQNILAVYCAWLNDKRRCDGARATKRGCSDASLLRCAAPDWPPESAFSLREDPSRETFRRHRFHNFPPTLFIFVSLAPLTASSSFSCSKRHTTIQSMGVSLRQYRHSGGFRAGASRPNDSNSIEGCGKTWAWLACCWREPPDAIVPFSTAASRLAPPTLGVATPLSPATSTRSDGPKYFKTPIFRFVFFFFLSELR